MKLNRKILKQMVLEEMNAMTKRDGQELMDDNPAVRIKSQLVQTIKTDYVNKILDATGVQAAEVPQLMKLLDVVLSVVDSTSVSESEAEIMADKIRQIAGAEKEM
jgi:hypothetical protein